MNNNQEYQLRSTSTAHRSTVLTISGKQFCSSVLLHNGYLNRPIVCDDRNIVGMEFPTNDVSATKFAEYIGLSKRVSILQSKGQETDTRLSNWANFFDTKDKTNPDDESFSVSIDITSTKLSELVSLPQFIKDLSWNNKMLTDLGIDKKPKPSSTTIVNNHTSTTAPLSGDYALKYNGQVNDTELLGYHGGGLHVAFRRRLESNKLQRFQSTVPCAERDPGLETQLFLSMSTALSYIDFHIDFGGSSAFYHIAKGEMWIYMVPPTPENLEQYRIWSTSETQNSIFFGDLVNVCLRCKIQTGSSIYIPSGWIYGVYAPDDLILFGSNFLCTNHISTQIQVHEIEASIGLFDSTKHHSDRLLFPHFKELLWYCAKWYYERATKVQRLSTNLSEVEQEQVKRLVSYLYQTLKTDINGYFIPAIIKQPVSLLQYLDQSLATPSHPTSFSGFENATDSNKTAQPLPDITKRKPKETSTYMPTLGTRQTNRKRKAYATTELGNSAVIEQHPNNATDNIVQCKKCKGYFDKKGLGPHSKRCDGHKNPRYAKPRTVVIPGGAAGTFVVSKHRSSCHRCGNLRQQVVACSKCPVIFCKRCSDKMIEAYSDNAFVGGCPVCKLLCCCSDKRATTCNRLYHCYKKCKAQPRARRSKKKK